jgi:hypothetical protein
MKYQQVYEPSHPLAHPKAGTLFVHRKNLYDHIGEGIHQCNWCGALLTWDGVAYPKLCVDHLYNDKSDNDPDHLVVSCHSCNIRRAPQWKGKLSPTDRRVTRHFLSQGKACAWIARLLNVDRKVIERVKNKQSYQRDLIQ